MYQLIESIYLKDGKFRNLPYHERRMNEARAKLFSLKEAIRLELILHNHQIPQQGLFKCRVIYGDEIYSIEFQPHLIKPISSIKLVSDNTIDYQYKFQDRGRINQLFELKADCDDVLIIKNQLVTDTSYANIVFKSSTGWITPAAPLLAGTMRSYLLNMRLIEEREIKRKDIFNFESFKLINAMIGFEMPELTIDNIID